MRFLADPYPPDFRQLSRQYFYNYESDFEKLPFQSTRSYIYQLRFLQL